MRGSRQAGGRGVANADGLELVYLLVEPAVRALELLDANTRRATEHDVAVVAAEVEDRSAQVVVLVLEVHLVAGVVGGILDPLVDKETDEAGDQDRPQQPADRPPGDPPGLLANSRTEERRVGTEC